MARDREFEAARTKTNVPQSLFSPLHYEPNYAYPLVVWLHGQGDDHHQLQRVMPLISLRNYVAVAPRGNSPVGAEGRGYAWSGDTGDAERAVFESIELACRRFHVAPHRIFLAGLQCGGTMALRIALGHASRFAGVLSIAGPFPQGCMPLAKLNESRRLPIFIAQGRDSKQYPLEKTCHELRLFHAAAMCVMLRQYPCGDDLDSQMFRDMDVWMMERVTGMPSADDHSRQTSWVDPDSLN